MPRLLVKVKKAVWQRSAPPSFLAQGDIPADCLSDLNIKNNQLSAWYVHDDRSNLNRVLTALAASGAYLSNVDYLLFDDAIVTELGLEIRKTAGGTPDGHANREWHRDLTQLSGRKVLDLAVAVFYRSEAGRELEKTLLTSIKAAVAKNQIDTSKLQPKLAARVMAGSRESTLLRFCRMWRMVRSSIGDAWDEFRRG